MSVMTNNRMHQRLLTVGMLHVLIFCSLVYQQSENKKRHRFGLNLQQMIARP